MSTLFDNDFIKMHLTKEPRIHNGRLYLNKRVCKGVSSGSLKVNKQYKAWANQRRAEPS